MDKFNVVSMASFSDFVAEAERDQVVRVNLSEKHTGTSIPSKRLTLDVQGRNDDGQLMWFSWSTTVFWSDGGPLMPDDQDKHEGMGDLCRVVQDTLKGMGYQVRSGRYVLPSDYVPINGRIDCAEWYRDDKDRLRVRPLELPMTTELPEATYWLKDASDPDAASVPVRIRVDKGGVRVRVPASDDGVHSAAEVYIEHYDGQVVARIWDKDRMNVGYEYHGVYPDSIDVTLLFDAADREMMMEVSND